MDAADLYLRSTKRPCSCLEFWKSHHPDCPTLAKKFPREYSDEYVREKRSKPTMYCSGLDCGVNHTTGGWVCRCGVVARRMDEDHQEALDIEAHEKELEVVHEAWAKEAMDHEDTIRTLRIALRDLIECGWMACSSETGDRITEEEERELKSEDREFVTYVCHACGDQTHNPDPAHHSLAYAHACPLAIAARLLASA